MIAGTPAADQVVLKVDNLSKTFKFYPSQAGRLKEWITLGRRCYHQDFAALSDISFEVRRGEFLGIIGPNGAGKSTLLKVITGVLNQTSGSYQKNGNVLSLLELSGGMDNDLTGRENILRSAQILGFPDNYARRRMDEIAQFADLGDFFDRPLLSYSSGMRIRLAFSLFAFLDCDILILDEVLAVGDIFFKQKCYERLEELIAKQVAVILVTHSTGIVRRYCSNVLVLNQGHIFYQGDADQAIEKYYLLQSNAKIRQDPRTSYVEEEEIRPIPRPAASDSTTALRAWPEAASNRPLASDTEASSEFAELTQLILCNSNGTVCQSFLAGEEVWFYVEYLLKVNVGVPVMGLTLQTVHNLLIHGKNSLQHRLAVPMKVEAGSRLRFRQMVRLDLAPGNYIFSLRLSALHPSDYARVDEMRPDEINANLIRLLGIQRAGNIEVFETGRGKNFLQPHTGLCNLAGDMQLEIINKVD